MGKSLLFIINPIAGKATIKNKICDITTIFMNYGYDVTIAPTQKGEDAYLYAKEKATQYDLIVCSGGDGTINEVTRAFVEEGCKRPFAYIPTGTVNDYATTLGLSKKPIACANQIMEGIPMACDVGQLENKTFNYIAAFGIFTDISYTTSQSTKNILGHGAYMLEGFKKMLAMKKFRMRIQYDDNVIEDTFCYGMITNSLSIGGFHFFNEQEIKLNDGFFECLFVKNPNNPLDLQQLAQAFITRNFNDCPRIYAFKAKHLHITNKKSIDWTADGEFAGSYKECDIINKNKCIQIIK